MSAARIHPATSRVLPSLLRRAGRALPGIVLFLVTLGGICAAGVATAMGESYPAFDRPLGGPSSPGLPRPKPIPGGRITVAVVVGGTGSVTADVLAPYEVFSRSDRFAVYTVAARRIPAALSGGLHLLPDHTLDEIASGALAEPDVVVVPAVADPGGGAEAPLRAWITARFRHGARVLGVCAGAELLAETGLLDGRRATSFWANLDSLERAYPRTRWERGQRYVEDGAVITTAGVTSGTVGALRLVEALAGTAEARRIGAGLHYPGWTPDGPTAITANHLAPSDLPYVLNAAFPWLRPTVGIGLVDGVGEIDVAAAFEVYSGVSFAARAIPVGATGTVTTRHGVVLLTEPAGGTVPNPARFLIPGVRSVSDAGPVLTRWASSRGLTPRLPGGGRRDTEFGFDPVLRDLAADADAATARSTAKFSEYPAGHLVLGGASWPWRPTALLAAALAVSAGAGLLPAAVRHSLTRRAAASAAP
ncbi:DJ-1/PfpI family protein [Streptosporangium sp. NPDC051022]|uniref:DJ-1/PfpI family protein n=1 Tax=Streptosporangium sp. NPDC051022 TaxID=3155752 RepID=UPI00343EFA5B